MNPNSPCQPAADPLPLAARPGVKLACTQAINRTLYPRKDYGRGRNALRRKAEARRAQIAAVRAMPRNHPEYKAKALALDNEMREGRARQTKNLRKARILRQRIAEGDQRIAAARTAQVARRVAQPSTSATPQARESRGSSSRVRGSRRGSRTCTPSRGDPSDSDEPPSGRLHNQGRASR